MKRNLFWKIMAILFFVWLLFFLWISSIRIDSYATIVVKANKITGDVYYLYAGQDEDWIKVGE